MTDQIDVFAGVALGDPIDVLRRQRPLGRDALQASYEAVFVPVDDSEFTLVERALISGFVTRLTSDDETAAAYAARAIEANADLAAVVLAEATASATSGPYGRYVEAGLADLSTEGPRYTVSDSVKEVVGERIAAALEHVHLLTYRPRESNDAALDKLLGAGWSIDGVVSLSQCIGFLATQQRVAAGLRVLNASIQKEAVA